MTRVVVRLHPQANDSCVDVCSPSKLRINGQNHSEQLTFDIVGGGLYSQQHLFQQIGTSVASSFKNGRQALIITLGQKGSGKSYSLFGNGGQAKGLVDMIGYDLKIKGFELTVSCFQIFNQQILDLMSPVTRARQLQHAKNKSSIAQLTEMKLLQHHNLQSLLQSARKNRKSVKINSQNQNQLSNSIVIVTLFARKYKSDIVKKVNFIELADYQNVFNNGRKLQVTGVNSKSMNSFIKMVHNQGNTFDYQSSKLTQILQNNLNNNFNKFVIAHIKPNKKHLNQTLFTLEIANKIKNLKQNNQQQLSYGTSSQQLQNEQYDSYQNLQSARRTTIIKTIQKNPLTSLVDNQKHFKNLIQLYQDRIYQMQKQQSSQLEIQKKILQKVAHQYASIVKNFPTFSQILVQNMNLKQQQLVSQKTICSPFVKKHKPTSFSIPTSSLQIIPHNYIDLVQIVKKQNNLLLQYEQMFQTLKQTFINKITDLSKYYMQLQNKNKTSTKLHFATSSIKNFIVQDQQTQSLKSQITLLRLQNKSLKKKNIQLLDDKIKKQSSYLQLQSLKIRLIQIRDSMIKDQNNQIKLKQEISLLKTQLQSYKKVQKQQNITIKKRKDNINKSYDINETSQTFLFEQSNSQFTNQTGRTYKQKQKLSLSQLLLKRIENKQNQKRNKNNGLKTCEDQCVGFSHPLIKSTYISPEKDMSKSIVLNTKDNREKKSKIQKSQLERLRLILLKSKEKANKTKINIFNDSLKYDMIQSKSSINIADKQASYSSSRANSKNKSVRPTVAGKQNRLMQKYRPYISDRQVPQNKSSF